MTAPATRRSRRIRGRRVRVQLTVLEADAVRQALGWVLRGEDASTVEPALLVSAERRLRLAVVDDTPAGGDQERGA